MFVDLAQKNLIELGLDTIEEVLFANRTLDGLKVWLMKII
jgi:hypothetical protein